MKILHTSDWHLGHTLYGYDRSCEHMDMLRQMVEIVRAEQPDVFVLCGDVYHSSQPSATVQTMFTDALVEIHKVHPNMTIVVTAGNHDSASKHEIFSTPWKALGVYAIGSFDADRKEELIIEIPGKGYVVAMPYVNERNLPKEAFQELLAMVKRLNTDGLPVVMMAHITISGCDCSGHENVSEYNVGGIDAYEIGSMGIGYDYLALGHIHSAQFVRGGNKRVRYSGTPVAVSFDEGHTHTVSVVDIGKHGDMPNVRDLEIKNIRPLVTLPCEGTVTWDIAMKMLEEFPDDIEAYIRLNVEVQDHLSPNANAEAEKMVKGKKCRFCVVNAHRPNVHYQGTHGMTVEEFKAEDPIELVRMFATDTGQTFDAEMEALFKQVLDIISEETRN